MKRTTKIERKQKKERITRKREGRGKDKDIHLNVVGVPPTNVSVDKTPQRQQEQDYNLYKISIDTTKNEKQRLRKHHIGSPNLSTSKAKEKRLQNSRLGIETPSSESEYERQLSPRLIRVGTREHKESLSSYLTSIDKKDSTEQSSRSNKAGLDENKRVSSSKSKRSNDADAEVCFTVPGESKRQVRIIGSPNNTQINTSKERQTPSSRKQVEFSKLDAVYGTTPEVSSHESEYDLPYKTKSPEVYQVQDVKTPELFFKDPGKFEVLPDWNTRAGETKTVTRITKTVHEPNTISEKIQFSVNKSKISQYPPLPTVPEDHLLVENRPKINLLPADKLLLLETMQTAKDRTGSVFEKPTLRTNIFVSPRISTHRQFGESPYSSYINDSNIRHIINKNGRKDPIHITTEEQTVDNLSNTYSSYKPGDLDETKWIEHNTKRKQSDTPGVVTRTSQHAISEQIKRGKGGTANEQFISRRSLRVNNRQLSLGDHKPSEIFKRQDDDHSNIYFTSLANNKVNKVTTEPKTYFSELKDRHSQIGQVTKSRLPDYEPGEYDETVNYSHVDANFKTISQFRLKNGLDTPIKEQSLPLERSNRIVLSQEDYSDVLQYSKNHSNMQETFTSEGMIDRNKIDALSGYDKRPRNIRQTTSEGMHESRSENLTIEYGTLENQTLNAISSKHSLDIAEDKQMNAFDKRRNTKISKNITSYSGKHTGEILNENQITESSKIPSNLQADEQRKYDMIQKYGTDTLEKANRGSIHEYFVGSKDHNPPEHKSTEGIRETRDNNEIATNTSDILFSNVIPDIQTSKKLPDNLSYMEAQSSIVPAEDKKAALHSRDFKTLSEIGSKSVIYKRIRSDSKPISVDKEIMTDKILDIKKGNISKIGLKPSKQGSKTSNKDHSKHKIEDRDRRTTSNKLQKSSLVSSIPKPSVRNVNVQNSNERFLPRKDKVNGSKSQSSGQSRDKSEVNYNVQDAKQITDNKRKSQGETEYCIHSNQFTIMPAKLTQEMPADLFRKINSEFSTITSRKEMATSTSVDFKDDEKLTGPKMNFLGNEPTVDETDSVEISHRTYENNSAEGIIDRKKIDTLASYDKRLRNINIGQMTSEGNLTIAYGKLENQTLPAMSSKYSPDIVEDKQIIAFDKGRTTQISKNITSYSGKRTGEILNENRMTDASLKDNVQEISSSFYGQNSITENSSKPARLIELNKSDNIPRQFENTTIIPVISNEPASKVPIDEFVTETTIDKDQQDNPDFANKVSYTGSNKSTRKGPTNVKLNMAPIERYKQATTSGYYGGKVIPPTSNTSVSKIPVNEYMTAIRAEDNQQEIPPSYLSKIMTSSSNEPPLQIPEDKRESVPYMGTKQDSTGSYYGRYITSNQTASKIPLDERKDVTYLGREQSLPVTYLGGNSATSNSSKRIRETSLDSRMTVAPMLEGNQYTPLSPHSIKVTSTTSKYALQKHTNDLSKGKDQQEQQVSYKSIGFSHSSKGREIPSDKLMAAASTDTNEEIPLSYQEQRNRYPIQNKHLDKEANGTPKINTQKDNQEAFPRGYSKISSYLDKLGYETPSASKYGNLPPQVSNLSMKNQKSFHIDEGQLGKLQMNVPVEEIIHEETVNGEELSPYSTTNNYSPYNTETKSKPTVPSLYNTSSTTGHSSIKYHDKAQPFNNPSVVALHGHLLGQTPFGHNNYSMEGADEVDLVEGEPSNAYPVYESYKNKTKPTSVQDHVHEEISNINTYQVQGQNAKLAGDRQSPLESALHTPTESSSHLPRERVPESQMQKQLLGPLDDGKSKRRRPYPPIRPSRENSGFLDGTRKEVVYVGRIPNTTYNVFYSSGVNNEVDEGSDGDEKSLQAYSSKFITEGPKGILIFVNKKNDDKTPFDANKTSPGRKPSRSTTSQTSHPTKKSTPSTIRSITPTKKELFPEVELIANGIISRNPIQPKPPSPKMRGANFTGALNIKNERFNGTINFYLDNGLKDFIRNNLDEIKLFLEKIDEGKLIKK